MSPNQASSLLEAPVFPLPNAILFPGVLLPLYIFEERYKLMVDAAVQGDRRLAISLLRKGPENEGAPSLVCGVGEIVRVEELPQGEKNIVVRGTGRAIMREIRQEVPYLRAVLQPIADLPARPADIERRRREIARLAQQLIFLLDIKDAARWMNLIAFLENPSLLSDFVSFYFLQDMSVKQDLLETLDVSVRMRRLKGALEGAIQGLEG